MFTDHLLHGADYNPDQWLDHPEILERDIELMQKAHCNVMSVGIFAWSTLEPQEGVFQLDWLEAVINRLYAAGIQTILATPSGARPAWLSQAYPEVLRVDASRVRALFGRRHNHCYTSPRYREKVKIINEQLARRLGNHPGVILWHLSNEYSGECHCPMCQEAFRKWLQDRYGTLGALNKAWYTKFWSHEYSDWQQIDSPSPQGESGLHGLNLDWRRFVSAQTIDFMCMERDSIRAIVPSAKVTTNMMYYFNDLNYFDVARAIDIASWDTYPTWHKENVSNAEIALDTAFFHDLVYTLKKSPFLLMENTPSQTNWQPIGKLKKPGMNLLSSLQAIAHGSDSVQYFQWRKSSGSFEKFHGAVVGHDGRGDTRVFNEVALVGEALEKLGPVAGTVRKCDVAIVYDWENIWALEDAQGPRNIGMGYKEEILCHYRGLCANGIQTDVIDMSCDLDGYCIIIAPMLYLLRSGFEEKLRAFVEAGGVLVTTYWSGLVNETDLCFLGETPHGLTDVLGLSREETDGLYAQERKRCVPTPAYADRYTCPYAGKSLCELVNTTTAESMLVFDEDFYQGRAAAAVNQYGDGTAYYLATRFENEFYAAFYRNLCTQHAVRDEVSLLPEGVVITYRESNEARYAFLQNFHDEEISLPRYDLRMKPWETVVMQITANDGAYAIYSRFSMPASQK